MKIEINNIDGILLLGGGNLLYQIVLWSLEEGAPIRVVTSPRHAKEIITNKSTLEEILKTNKVPYIITENIKTAEIHKFIGDSKNLFCLSIGAPWIFDKESIKTIFNNLLFNLHGTGLPKDRGGGGFSWQILMGKRFGFCQLHLIDGGIDTGDLIRTKEFLYPAKCRIPSDYRKIYSEMNLYFIIDFIEEIRTEGVSLETYKQIEYLSTYWPRLNTPIQGWINFDYTLDNIEKFICAFDDPYEGAKCFLNDEIVYIKKVSTDFSSGSFHSFQNGIIYRVNKNWVCCSISPGTLIIESITNEKGINIINKIKPGDRIYTPTSKLESKNNRPIYTPNGLK